MATASRNPGRKHRGSTLALTWLYLAWGNMMFDGQSFLAAKISVQFGRLGLLINLPVMLIAAVYAVDSLGGRRAWIIAVPMGVLLLVGVLNMPWAANPVLAKDALKVLLLFWTMMIATAAIVRTPQQAVPLVVMFLFRFGWFEAWARTAGLVAWHPTLSNYDGYGAFMVGAAGSCYWAALSASSNRTRIALVAFSALGVLGVVASFARGAFLSLVVVALMIWLRSPRKAATAIALIAGAVLVSLGASVIFEDNFFWNEISSAFVEGNDEGTGALRWQYWVAAFRVWQAHPVLGVGPSNVGAFSAGYFKWGEIEMFENPAMFYGFNTHNAYLTILAEYGVIGLAAFTLLHVDFFLKNRQLREHSAIEVWNRCGAGSRFDIRYLSFALEAMLVALMLANVLYASLLESWLWTTFALNRVLWSVTRDGGSIRTVAARVGRGHRKQPGVVG